MGVISLQVSVPVGKRLALAVKGEGRVRWGESSSEAFKSTGTSYVRMAHVYALEGTHVVTVSGTITGFATLSLSVACEGQEYIDKVLDWSDVTLDDQTRARVLGMCVNLTSVPDSFFSLWTLVGAYAFYKCEKLVFPALANLEEVGGLAFYNCRKLSRVSLSSLKYVGMYAFKGCTSFTGSDWSSGQLWPQSLPSTVELSTGAFEGCTALNLYIINVAQIPDFCFKGCTELGCAYGALKGDIHAVYIGKHAFSGCRKLTPASVTAVSVGEGAFKGCESLDAYISGWAPVEIPAYCFYNCRALTSVPDLSSVVKVGDYAFFNCLKLPVHTLPNTLTEIGEAAFAGCAKLNAAPTAPEWTSVGAWGFALCSELKKVPAIIDKVGRAAFLYCTKARSDSLSSESVGDFAFCGCSSLGLKALTDSEYIGAHAFDGCSSLSLASLPAGIAEIGEGTFSGCTKLALTALPATVGLVGARAFRGCSGMTMPALPTALESIGAWAFSGCSKLGLQGIPSELSELGQGAFSRCVLGGVVTPAGITVIPVLAFSFSRFTGSVSLSNAVVHVAKNSFLRTSGTAMAELPNGIESIGVSAFGGSEAARFTRFPSALTDLGVSAFAHSDIVTFDFSSAPGLESIPDCAFWSLRRFHPLGMGAEYVIPENIKSIGALAFYDDAGVSKKKDPISGRMYFIPYGIKQLTISGDSDTKLAANSFYKTTPYYDVTVGWSKGAVPYAKWGMGRNKYIHYGG